MKLFDDEGNYVCEWVRKGQKTEETWEYLYCKKHGAHIHKRA